MKICADRDRLRSPMITTAKCRKSQWKTCRPFRSGPRAHLLDAGLRRLLPPKISRVSSSYIWRIKNINESNRSWSWFLMNIFRPSVPSLRWARAEELRRNAVYGQGTVHNDGPQPGRQGPSLEQLPDSHWQRQVLLRVVVSHSHSTTSVVADTYTIEGCRPNLQMSFPPPPGNTWWYDPTLFWGRFWDNIGLNNFQMLLFIHW